MHAIASAFFCSLFATRYASSLLLSSNMSLAFWVTSWASVPFDWERFVSVVGAPGALVAALGWFLSRAWRELAPLLKAWLQSQLENDQVHRQAVRQMTARQEQLQLGHIRTHRALFHAAQAIEAGAAADRRSEVQPHVAAACREVEERIGSSE